VLKSIDDIIVRPQDAVVWHGKYIAELMGEFV
jgi:hypothetical protein